MDGRHAGADTVMRTSTPLRASLLLAALGAALAASADQIVHTFSIDSLVGNAESSYDAFSPSLGTLTSVVIALDVRNSGSASLLNRGADATNQELYTFSRGGLVISRPYLPYPDYQEYVAYGIGVNFKDTVGDLAHGASFTNDLSYTGGVNVDAGFDNDGNAYETDTGVFTGRALETFYARSAGEQNTVDLFDDTYVYATTLPHSSSTYDFDGTMTATVTYNYTPVPEPSAFAALGLGALGILRRRRR